MENSYYAAANPLSTGISIAYTTAPGGYFPLHWHEELEILYPLNGAADITIEGKKFRLLNKHMLVVESRKVHSTYTYDELSMFVCIHVSKKHIRQYFPEIDSYQILCTPENASDEQFPLYRNACELLEALTRLYMEEPPTYRMEAEGIVLQIVSRLIRFFSVKQPQPCHSSDTPAMERIRDVITYVEEHFREPVALDDAASLLGLGREYFCRFFKRNMGMTFLNYLNEVRLAHAYADLLNTNAPISEVMEANGFTNQKLFNSSFKTLYGCTPSSIRREHSVSE
ncbi:MAG: AraC family transcriptional regulator [Lachnospiraceae bacterium]|nr:AraC family transcriptional regulator [Lachnospiraceae bacterium]